MPTSEFVPKSYSDSKIKRPVYPAAFRKELPDEHTATRAVLVDALYYDHMGMPVEIYGADRNVYRAVKLDDVEPGELVVLEYLGKFNGISFMWRVVSS